MRTTRYDITLKGCHESTLITADLTGQEFTVIERIVLASTQASECGCQPVMTIERHEDA